MLVSYDLSHTNTSAFGSIMLFVLRTIIIIGISVVIRKRNYDVLENNNIKIYNICIITLFVLSIVLNLFGLPREVLFSLSFSVGIYNLQNSNLFLVVLWEQIFLNFLISHLLLCLTIVFFKKPKQYHLNHTNID